MGCEDVQVCKSGIKVLTQAETTSPTSGAGPSITVFPVDYCPVHTGRPLDQYSPFEQ